MSTGLASQPKFTLLRLKSELGDSDQDLFGLWFVSGDDLI